MGMKLTADSALSNATWLEVKLVELIVDDCALMKLRCYRSSFYDNEGKDE